MIMKHIKFGILQTHLIHDASNPIFVRTILLQLLILGLKTLHNLNSNVMI